MDLGLGGKVALVGGASRGLGYACALELAREGARVSLCSRSEPQARQAAERIAKETGAQTAGFGLDLAAPDAGRRWVEASLARFGSIEILVHNTGGPPPGAFDELEDRHWQEAFDLLVLSAVRLYRAVIPAMQKGGWGRVVAIESIAVKEPIDGLLLSNALRPAVIALNKSLTRSLAAQGILFNAVAPGIHDTERWRSLAEDRARRAGRPVEEMLEEARVGFPRRRAGSPEELAAVVAFLCSERASNVGGTTLVADGGASRSLY
jgi:3-oxoacyl-[acyl-carrier protein] reductase